MASRHLSKGGFLFPGLHIRTALSSLSPSYALFFFPLSGGSFNMAACPSPYMQPVGGRHLAFNIAATRKVK